MIGPLLEIVSQVLQLFNKIIDRKFINRLDNARRAYAEEQAKGDLVSAAALDNLEREIFMAMDAILEEAKQKAGQ